MLKIRDAPLANAIDVSLYRERSGGTMMAA
jgi:hypothetical protein